ncbi:BLUF domain-containing protein [Amaricoccus macauensis]|uniref:BLUF domain-containing protein n=1 Tax=Amaricoccus macauensis TaxID=57001 RepID=UPI003C7E6B90
MSLGFDDETACLVRIVFVCEIVGDLSGEAVDAHRRELTSDPPEPDLTGLLLSQGNRVCGVVEGPQESVLAHVDRIAVDRNHQVLRVLDESPIETRRFVNWTTTVLPAGLSAKSTDEMTEEFIEFISRRL